MEKSTFHEQLRDLRETFGQDTKEISITMAAKYLGRNYRTLMADHTFPMKQTEKKGSTEST